MKLCKRALSLLTIITLALTLILPISVYAGSSNPLVVSFSSSKSTDLKVGDTFSVSLILNGVTQNNGVGSFGPLNMEYDSNIISITTITSGPEVHTPADLFCETTTTPNTIIINYSDSLNNGSNHISTDGVVAVFNFTVIATPSSGNSTLINLPGSTYYDQNYDVIPGPAGSVNSVLDTSLTLNFAPTYIPSSAKAITAFSINGNNGAINESAKTIAVTVPYETDVTNLTPTITVSDKATVSPISGAAQNFSSPVTYTVTAEDTSSVPYTVTVTKAAKKIPNINLTIKDQATRTFQVVLSNLPASGSTYQIWSEDYYSDSGFSYWRLIKGYSDSFTSGSTMEWQVNSPIKESYRIFVRVKDADGITQYTRQITAVEAGALKINCVKLNGEIPVNNFFINAGNKVKIEASASKSGVTSGITYSYSIDGQASTPLSNDWDTTGLLTRKYELKVVAKYGTDFTDSVTLPITVIGGTTDMPVLSGNGISVTDTQVGANTPISVLNNAGNPLDAQNSISISIPYSKMIVSPFNSASATYQFNYPGYYVVSASVKANGAKIASDTAYKTIKVNRNDSTVAPTLKASDISFSKALKDVTNANSTVITPPANNNVQYSFWVLSYNGWHEAAGWGSTSFTWAPKYNGKYFIQIRVRDIKYNQPNASYEAAVQFTADIGATDAGVVTINTTGTKVAKQPVTITADTNYAGKERVEYRYIVYNDYNFTVIEGYTPATECTWIPARPGTYRVQVLAKEDGNEGYFDSQAETSITIN